MANEQIKWHLPSLAIKEVQFKVIIRYQWLLIKIAHLKKKVLTPNAGKHAEKLNHICIVLGTEDGTAAPEICLAVSYKTDMLSYDPAITLPGLYSREIKTHIHGKALHITMAITVFKSKNWKHTQCHSTCQRFNSDTSLLWTILWQWKRTNYWYIQPLGWFTEELCWGEMPVPRGNTVYGSMCMVLLK